MNSGQQSQGELAVNNEFMSAVSSNFRTFSFITVPFFVLANALFYRKKKMNLVEHSVVVFYALSWPFLFSCLFIVTYSLFDTHLQLWSTLIVALYYAWVCTMYYSKNKILGFFKGIFALLFGYVIMVVVIVLVFVGYLLLNPEMLKQFAPPQ
jgi:hypothetical protein